MPKPKKREIRRQLMPGEEVLPNHDNFVKGIVLEGLSSVASYRKYVAQPGTKVETMWARSSELSSKYKERIEQLRATVKDFLRDQLQFTQESLAKYLVEAIETPIGDIDEGHRLAQEMTIEKRGGQRGTLKRGHADEGNEESTPEIDVIKIKMLPKSEAIKLLTAMTGWNAAEKVAVSFAPVDEAIQSAMDNGLLDGLAERLAKRNAKE